MEDFKSFYLRNKDASESFAEANAELEKRRVENEKPEMKWHCPYIPIEGTGASTGSCLRTEFVMTGRVPKIEIRGPQMFSGGVGLIYLTAFEMRKLCEWWQSVDTDPEFKKNGI